MIVNPENPSQLIDILKSKPLVLYGMGGAGLNIARWCEEKEIGFVFADKDAVAKQSASVIRVVAPELLTPEFLDANVVIASIVYYDEIFETLHKLGFTKEQLISYSMFMQKKVTWKDLELSTAWGEDDNRIKVIAEWIPEDTASVADYGAGKLRLKGLLSVKTKYYPIDYIKRSEDTVICDFNEGVFPEIQAEISVCTATLVFVTTAKELLKHLCKNTMKIIILSYVTGDTFADTEGRRASGYVGDLTEREIVDILFVEGFYLKEKRKDPANNIDTLYLFINNHEVKG